MALLDIEIQTWHPGTWSAVSLQPHRCSVSTASQLQQTSCVLWWPFSRFLWGLLDEYGSVLSADWPHELWTHYKPNKHKTMDTVTKPKMTIFTQSVLFIWILGFFKFLNRGTVGISALIYVVFFCEMMLLTWVMFTFIKACVKNISTVLWVTMLLDGDKTVDMLNSIQQIFYHHATQVKYTT